MNRYKANNSGELARAAPLFASSWLALFDLLYNYFSERHLPQAGRRNEEKSRPS